MPTSMSTSIGPRRLALVLVASLAVVSLVPRPAAAARGLMISGGTASEQETVEEAWRLVLDTFPHLRHCVSWPAPEVVIRPSNHVGIYDYRIDTIILRSGGFRLPDAVHEFAHHLDWECGFEFEDESALFALTDLAVHLRDSGWRYRPLEIFAETVVKLVLGEEASSAGGRASDLHPGPEIQDFVNRWGRRGAAALPAIRSTFALVPL